MTDAKVIEAFQMMWGNFPDPVMLVHKSREILAVNASYNKLGVVPGIKCSSMGTPERHKRCLANKALASQQAAFFKGEVNGKSVIGFWIPVVGYPDIYVHFGVGMMIDYDQYPAAVK
ncbi:hypothetical protein [Propionispora hippei]|uniref:PAS domain-containing protein n=1 Tax=Propionispora hippei DSM 15287 TaxID=1123003 RepID=A0A1M6E1F6_9FIRM|nr:hypothetical protein [Propionispora hippei]SHI79108.1 hypothetical protein SAMN02745170_01084 [Propionispora hippei DSM 15287]